MSKIAVLIDNMFENVEYTEPVKAFKQEGHEIVNIGLKKGAQIKGKRAGTVISIDMAVKDSSVQDFDALLIPGGYSPDHLRTDKRAVEFVREFTVSGKPVFVICHGPQLLISADVLKGRKITGWKSIVQDIKNAGAEFIDQPVVEDGNIISSRNPQDIPKFVKACNEKLYQMVGAK